MSHPWAINLNVRGSLSVSTIMDPPQTDPPPHQYDNQNLILPPASKSTTHRELITLADVVAFRNAAGKKAQNMNKNRKKAKKQADVVEALSDQMKQLKVAETRPVIYRFIDVYKKSYGILEAIHFELFMPDRPDLRFIVVPKNDISANEGDYFFVYTVQRVPESIPSMGIEGGYAIVWMANRCVRIESKLSSVDDYVYIVHRSKAEDAEVGVSNWADSFLHMRGHRFEEKCSREANAICDATVVDTSSAWIYPVEPVKNRFEYANMVSKIRSSSRSAGVFASSIRNLLPKSVELIKDRLRTFNYFAKNPEDAERLMISLFMLGSRFRSLITPPEMRVAQVKSTAPPILLMQLDNYNLKGVTLIFDEIKKIQLKVLTVRRYTKDRRKRVAVTCGHNDELIKALGKQPSNVWTDALLQNDDKNIVIESLKTIECRLDDTDDKMKEAMSVQPKILSYLYKKNAPRFKYKSGLRSVMKKDGKTLTLNERQSRAMIIYEGLKHPGFCILSPPGSGKTTVAAAMAASFGDGGVQLLLAVQNVAVDNLAESLESFDNGTLRAYHVQSFDRLDASSPMPYDVFEELPRYERWMYNAKDADIGKVVKYLELAAKRDSGLNDKGHRLSREEMIKLEHALDNSLRAAKSALERYLRSRIILSTVDMILYRMHYNESNPGLVETMKDAEKIIIDEASLLTESTFYCLIRAFPKAKFVLIGDDKQLPPFMYDEHITGHELAGRSALNVAMKFKNLPVIQLVEVYRAPQALVEPYNHLSYNGRLISRKMETIFPLTNAGLVKKGSPQLLFVNVQGQSRSKGGSQYNYSEKEALLRLLKKFPADQKDDIMIISLYKEQKRQIERSLGTDYDVYTVDSSQGKEKPIVIVLTSRSKPAGNMTFFNCQNRCTVAVSRQQRALIIFGCSQVLNKCSSWKKVVKNGKFTRVNSKNL